MKLTNTCKNCGILVKETGQCALSGSVKKPNDFCSDFKQVIEVCASCGNPILNTSTVVLFNDQVQTLCSKCASRLGYCITCFKRSECLYETDPSPIPKKVQRRIQKGPMITVTEVKNPERIEITCKMKCLCFDPILGCRKEIGLCNDYQSIWEV